jgi:hypothetical protein
MENGEDIRNGKSEEKRKKGIRSGRKYRKRQKKREA